MTNPQALADLGLPDWVAAGAYTAFGPGAASVIDGDPWSVLAVTGVRPEQADAYARTRLGAVASATDPRRLHALVTWLVRQSSRDGHTILPAAIAMSALETYEIDAEAAVAAASAAGSIASVPGGLALPAYADAEQAIADAVRREPPTSSAAAAATGVSASSVADLANYLLGHGVGIMTGGPGDRLDDAVRTLASAARERGLPVTAIAPTATTARRLSGLIGEPANVQIGSPVDDSGSPGVVLVSDAQAFGVADMAAIVRATPSRTNLLLAGDVHGLPSVDGPGNVLGDLVASGRVPWIDTEDGDGGSDAAATVADLATSIGRGVLPPVESPGKDVVVVPAVSAAEAQHRAIQLVTEAIPRTTGIDQRDVVVLTPAVRGLAGADALNVALKAALNPATGAANQLDIGDRVAVTADVGSTDVRTGDVGVVVDVAPDSVLIEVAGNDIRVLQPSAGVLRHAWALTVARAAVGRWPAGVLVLPAESAGLLTRALLRTAVSRAEHHLSIVHAAGPTVARTVRHGRVRRRRTALPDLIRDALG